MTYAPLMRCIPPDLGESQDHKAESTLTAVSRLQGHVARVQPVGVKPRGVCTMGLAGTGFTRAVPSEALSLLEILLYFLIHVPSAYFKSPLLSL